MEMGFGGQENIAGRRALLEDDIEIRV